MPGAGHNTSAAILSSVAFDKDAQYFATAGVSKRISIYSFDKAVEGFGPHHSSQARMSPLQEIHRWQAVLSIPSISHQNHTKLPAEQSFQNNGIFANTYGKEMLCPEFIRPAIDSIAVQLLSDRIQYN